MIRDTFEEIIKQNDVRQNLSKLRKELKEPGAKHALLYNIGDQEQVFQQFLFHEDAKVRKNAALLMGDLAVKTDLAPLVEAYNREDKLFVKSSYLTAIKEFDYRDYVEEFKERLEELSKVTLTEENKKHITEEMRALSDLVVAMEGIRHHKFIGFHEPSTLVLLTNRDQIEATEKQLINAKTKAFNAGVMAKTEDLEEVLEVRTFDDLLFVVEGMKVLPNDIEECASQIVNSELLDFLTARHKGKVPFYFRIELKTKWELSKKSAFTKKLSGAIERLSNRKLVNTTSNYEVELRLIENKEGTFNTLVKLYTIEDKRFNYRKEVLATSIRPTNAALTVELAKPYMKEDAQVLDPFCGVGTMLIERHKAVKANTTYGIDVYGDAIEKARINTEAARQIIHYINRDFFDFKHEYLFDEIITNMPFAIGRKTQEEIEEVYLNFFKKAPEHLKEDATIILYSHDKDLVKRFAPRYGFKVVEEFLISKREGTYVFVIK
ncbi:MAG: methyltransferase [bacterium]|nr:methyltransferase [bacterium]